MAEVRTGVVAQLDALEAAHKAGTPGLWHVMRSADDRRAYVITTARVVTDSAGCAVSDAAAIVAEHNAFPELLAAVRGVLALADEWNIAAELYDAAALDAQARFDLMAEGGHLIQAGDARRFADRLRATVAAALGEA